MLYRKTRQLLISDCNETGRSLERMSDAFEYPGGWMLKISAKEL